jgi:hypothetical protein
MNISFASAQGSGKANEDGAGATSSCAVVLDGITSPPGLEGQGRRHSRRWPAGGASGAVLGAVAAVAAVPSS